MGETATEEEQRDLTRAILEDLLCDPETERLIALRPKADFRLLLRQIDGLNVHNGAFTIG